MTLLAVMVLLTLAVNLAVSDKGEVQVALPTETIKTDDVPKRHNYFSKEAAEAAARILQYGDVDDSLKRHVEELKETSEVARALKKYQTDKESIAGTKCADADSEEDRFNGADVSIQVIVETCASAAPTEDREVLGKEVKEVLVKVQEADIRLMENARLCASLRTEQPPSCEEEKRKQLEIIKSCVSPQSLAHITYYFRNAFFNTKASIDSCLSEGTKDLKDNLEEWDRKITECKETVN